MRRAPVAVTLVVLAAVAALVLAGASAAAVDGSQAGPASGPDDGRYAAELAVQEDAEEHEGTNDSQEEHPLANESVVPTSTPEERAAIADGDLLVEPCAAASPADHADPADDPLGWEAGYWYDEPVAIEDPDALSDAELEALVARTAARVEALRCLEFESLPSVATLNASEMADRQTVALRNQSAAATKFDDARLEAGLLVGTEVDPVEARLATRSAAVRAAYEHANGTVALLDADGAGTSVDEATLAHELVHALQDQHHDLSRFDAQRTDRELAESGLLEGDAVLVERRFEARCGDGWNQTCLEAPSPESDGDASTALNLLLYQPYNDGPEFVQGIYADGGWAMVDLRYDRPPRSSYEVLFPATAERAGEFDVANATTDASTPAERGWQRVRPPNQPDHDVVGPGAIAAALLAPTFEGQPDALYDAETIRRSGRIGARGGDRYDYRLDAVEGWRGDRLVAFENDGGQTGTVWRSEWASAEDAREFRSRYVELLSVRGAEPADGYQGTYRFGERSAYDGAVYVVARDDAVVVVHGPSVQSLRALYDGAAPAFEGGFFEAISAGQGERALDRLPGGAVPAALAALVVGAAVLVRRFEREES